MSSVDDYDGPWKEALEALFEAFVRLFRPDLHDAIDWTRGVELLDKELQQLAPQGSPPGHRPQEVRIHPEGGQDAKTSKEGNPEKEKEYTHRCGSYSSHF
jgi:hypothetical protein